MVSSVCQIAIRCVIVLIFVVAMPSAAFAQDVLADNTSKKPKGIEFRSNTEIIVIITVFDFSVYSMYKWYTTKSEYGIVHDKFDWLGLWKSGWKSAIIGLIVGIFIWSWAIDDDAYEQTSEFLVGSDGIIDWVELIRAIGIGMACIYGGIKFQRRLHYPRG